MAAELRADQDIHRLAAEVLDLARCKTHDTASIQENQDAGDRCKKMGVNSENVRPRFDRRAHN